MVFIKVDMKKLQTFIFNLQDWQIDAEVQRDKVKKKVDVEDPANILSIVNSGTWLDKLTKHLNSLRGSLETRRLNVEAVNKASGISLTSDECGYYLPDGVEDNTANVTAYNMRSIENGKELASKLQEACLNGKTKDGKYTVDQLMAEIAKHQDVPTFGLGVMNYYSTPEKFLMNVEHNYQDLGKLKGKDDAGDPLMTMYGHLFAAASQLGDGKYGQRLANDYANYLQTNKTSQGNDIATFNELLSVPGTVYGTDFLYTAGTRLESLDPSKVQPKVPPHYFQRQTSREPLAGVLNAMGRNPEAALKYLADEGTMSGQYWIPSENAKKRWANLSKRKDLDYSDDYVNSFTAALAAASSYRNTSYKSTDSNYLPNADARATWLTAKTVRHFVYDVKVDDFTETMKQNIGTVLSNSPEELTAESLNVDFESSGVGPNIGGSIERGDLTRLLYRVIDNEKASTLIGASLGEYQHKKINDAMSSGKWSSPTNLAEMYGDAAGTQGYLTEVANARLNYDQGKDSASYAKKRENINTGLSVFSTVAVAGATALSGGAALPLATSVGLSIASPEAANYFAGEEQKRGLPGVAENKPSAQDLIRLQAYTDAAKNGFLRNDSVELAKSKGVLFNKDGSVIKRKPSEYTSEDATKLNTWLQKAQMEEKVIGSDGKPVKDANGNDMIKKYADETADDIDAEITQGRSRRQDMARTLLSTDKGLKQDQELK